MYYVIDVIRCMNFKNSGTCAVVAHTHRRWLVMLAKSKCYVFQRDHNDKAKYEKSNLKRNGM